MIILDTNVVSELMRPSPSARLADWFSKQPPEAPHTTTITLAEIFYGIELLPEGKRRAMLQAGAQTMFSNVFANRIFTFDIEAAHAFSRIAADRRKRGRPIAEMDAQIAAIAQLHGATLATRNTADFEGCGIRLANPWLD